MKNPEINLTLKSTDPSVSFTIPTQRDHNVEFMKVLSLAHMCVPEFFNQGKEKFYNGPSPDEVALVEFASHQHFDCIESTRDIIQMVMTSQKGVSMTHTYEVFRKMDFNSDRKRMSVLLRDPLDGQIKLYIKGADSIILDRLDQKLNKLTPE